MIVEPSRRACAGWTASFEGAGVDGLVVVGVLSLLFQFLANEREIVTTGFENAALIGQALADVWEYAFAVLLIAMVWNRERE